MLSCGGGRIVEGSRMGEGVEGGTMTFSRHLGPCSIVKEGDGGGGGVGMKMR